MKTTWLFLPLLLILGFGCDSGTTEPEPTDLSHSLSIEFRHSFGSDAFSLNQDYTNAAGNILSFSTFKYLISQLELVQEDGEVLDLAAYGYINPADNRLSLQIDSIPTGNYTELRFMIGLDSLDNHGNPNQWSANHPLNPILNNMHWGWAGGYIFLAMEGMYQADANTNEAAFSYHVALLENRMPISIANQNLELNADKTLTLNFDVAETYSNIDMAEEGSFTHSSNDGGTALKLARNTQNAFTFVSYE